MTLNQKEDRVLAKTFGTLDLERKFSKNVLDLHLRTVKSNYRNLKDKVSKIKSNLSPDEIVTLRQLEQEGKIKPANTFNLNAALKIAAAARRLKLCPTQGKRAQSAKQIRSVVDNDKLLQGRSNTDTHLLRKRSNSVTGVFIDAPVEEKTARRNSIEVSTEVAIRPLSAVQVEKDVAPKSLTITKERPATSVGNEREKPQLLVKASTTTGSRPVSHNAPFSSHEAAEKEANGVLPVPKSARETKHTSVAADDSIENNLGTDLFEERRLELLQEEQLFYTNLNKRKNDFISNIDAYLLENPPVKFDIPFTQAIPIIEATRQLENGTNSDGDEEDASGRFRRRLRRYDQSRTFTSEEAYRERDAELWKDMNKTRYLRVADDQLDLSGVVTLAKDQMKLYKLLKSTKPAHIVSH